MNLFDGGRFESRDQTDQRIRRRREENTDKQRGLSRVFSSCAETLKKGFWLHANIQSIMDWIHDFRTGNIGVDTARKERRQSVRHSLGFSEYVEVLSVKQGRAMRSSTHFISYDASIESALFSDQKCRFQHRSEIMQFVRPIFAKYWWQMNLSNAIDRHSSNDASIQRTLKAFQFENTD